MERISEFMAMQMRIRPALVIFFAVFLAASVPLLYYYRRKNPNPRFRPSNGEMTLVSVLAVGFSFVLAFALSSAFDSEHQLRNMQGKPQDENASYSEVRGRSGRGKSDGKGKEEPPPPPPPGAEN